MTTAQLSIQNCQMQRQKIQSAYITGNFASAKSQSPKKNAVLKV